MKQYSGRQRAYEKLHWRVQEIRFQRCNAERKASKEISQKEWQKKKKKWKKEIPKDPLKNQRVVIAFGDAKMAFNMPGTLSVSHRKLKHYMAIASKRLGRFTAEEVGQDSPLIGQLKFQVVDIPEYMTSQASSI